MTLRFISNQGTWLLAHDFRSLPCSHSRYGKLNNVVRRWLHLRRHDDVGAAGRWRRSKKEVGRVPVAACLDVSAKSFRHKGQGVEVAAWICG